jgi:cell shape-determining protein MreC
MAVFRHLHRRIHLKENQLVITGLGVAGKIIEVGFNTSKVMLINDPRINIPVITQSSRQDGLATGTLQKNLLMKQWSPMLLLMY